MSEPNSEKEYSPIIDLDINDKYILNILMEKDEKISFIRPGTRTLIAELRQVDLHLQTKILCEIWKKLIGDAIIYLKSKDGRERFHDDMTLGTKKLFEFLEEFQEFEPILYGAVPNYRDHVAHVFRVYLLGQLIIKKAIGFENISPTKDDKLAISAEEKEAIWCIIALSHDLGYSLERIHYINQKARKMLQQFGNIPVQELGIGYFTQFGFISDFVIKFLSSKIVEVECKKERKEETESQEEKKRLFYTHLQAKYYQKFLSALSEFNHGVISSVILMKNLVYFKESDYTFDEMKYLIPEDARQFMIRKEILRPIASHAYDDVYFLGIKNFSFILRVCDEMQEWGRPRLIDVLRRGGSETELRIQQFDDEMVDYKVTFDLPEGYSPSETESKTISDDVSKYFKAKCTSWLNVLRSAVIGYDRKLKLNFTVEDKTQNEAKTYKLTHENPSNFKIEPKDIQKEILGN